MKPRTFAGRQEFDEAEAASEDVTVSERVEVTHTRQESIPEPRVAVTAAKAPVRSSVSVKN